MNNLKLKECVNHNCRNTFYVHPSQQSQSGLCDKCARKARKTFFTESGWLTPYAFACGYRHQSSDDVHTVALASNNTELDTYDVIVTNATGRIVWDICEGVADARKKYRQHVRTFLRCTPHKRHENSVDRIVYA